MRNHLVFSLLLIFLSPGLASQSSLAADSIVVNPSTSTYDHHPSAALVDNGSVWTAWHAYNNGRDQILARQTTADGTTTALHVVNQSGGVHGPPTLTASPDGHVSVVWAAKLKGRWQIILREWRAGDWLKERVLSDPNHDAVFPAAARTHSGALIAAWTECTEPGFQIRACEVKSNLRLARFDVSQKTPHAFRPTLVVGDSDKVWCFWDQYATNLYSVHGRQLLPELNDIECVSPVDGNCLKPTAIWHDDHLYVAYLSKTDVVGGPRVFSQFHTLHTARRTKNGWQTIHTADGDTAAAELTQGLMAKIDPRPVATGGYLGARTRPMLVSDQDRLWLLWERKSNHRGSTPKVPGDLVGRPCINGEWQTPVVLKQERVDYHLVHPAESQNGEVRLLLSRLPQNGRRTYELTKLNLDHTQPFQQDEWTGWDPVDLTSQIETGPRRTITCDGKTYNLYWADLHCHNGLTADAEGEPDEMHHYARDRAKLDVVVFTNNDFYNVPLTQYDFELGNLLANRFTAEFRHSHRPLLSLPGFEWTSRIPGIATAELSDAGNWLPPYRNRSYPNHRSVIYPPTGGPLVHFTEVGNDISQLNEAVEGAGGITLSQHNAFRLSGHPVEVGLELTSGWSNYISARPNLFHTSLNSGARLGFTANGDTHRRTPGLSGALTGIYAEELTAEAILDALRERRCFATMGSRVFIDSRANDTLMGQEVVTADGSVALVMHAESHRDILKAVLVMDGREIHTATGSTTELATTKKIDSLSKGVHWCYWRIHLDGFAPSLPGNLMPAFGNLSWSSPHWIVVE